MLRFNRASVISLTQEISFQYILCYGSTRGSMHMQEYKAEFQYILCYGSTWMVYKGCDREYAFQYILCYGSTTSSIG